MSRHLLFAGFLFAVPGAAIAYYLAEAGYSFLVFAMGVVFQVVLWSGLTKAIFGSLDKPDPSLLTRGVLFGAIVVQTLAFWAGAAVT